MSCVSFFFMFEMLDFDFYDRNLLIFFRTFNSFNCCEIDFIRINQCLQDRSDFFFDHDIDRIAVFVDSFDFNDFASFV